MNYRNVDMEEDRGHRGAVTLSVLSLRVKEAVNTVARCWVVGEISEMQINSKSGHCYMQLAEKGNDGMVVLASARATLWAGKYRELNAKFGQYTGQGLSKGMKVMVLVKPVFHEVFGYSLNIEDVDPSFTMGEIEKKRREIIKRLEAEGVIDQNRELEFPMLPKRVAVISSDTAAGLGDFRNHIQNNRFGYVFHIEIFPAIMQGDNAEDSICSALERIVDRYTDFDVAVIIRGGGATLDLSCFDSYRIGEAVANMPLPVISGIGHERDNSIVDLVANKRVKTPTAAADLLIDSFIACDRRCMECAGRLGTTVRAIISSENLKHGQLSSRFHSLYASCIFREQKYMDVAVQRLKGAVGMFLQREKDGIGRRVIRLGNACERMVHNSSAFLEKAEAVAKYSDPQLVLDRGFSVTTVNGRILKNAEGLAEGDEMVTRFSAGNIISTIKKIDNGGNNDL